ncbi:hypothetical protein M0802_003191 [Mischocyttarus mexicanus]|nr:hypothetical protein M0802_003191 [Mischocyttarus mexicanus]
MNTTLACSQNDRDKVNYDDVNSDTFLERKKVNVSRNCGSESGSNSLIFLKAKMVREGKTQDPIRHSNDFHGTPKSKKPEGTRERRVCDALRVALKVH